LHRRELYRQRTCPAVLVEIDSHAIGLGGTPPLWRGARIVPGWARFLTIRSVGGSQAILVA